MRLLYILLTVITLTVPVKGQATPVTERTTLDAVEVFEIKPGDETLVCARFAGDTAELTAGSIDGADFVPLKGKVVSLKQRIKRASGTKRGRLQRQLRTLQGRMKRCRNEGALSPLVVEEIGCGHRLSIDECQLDRGCTQLQLQVATGVFSTVEGALKESLDLCGRYIEELFRYQELIGARTGSSTNYSVSERQGCVLFGCGIAPKGMSWNVHIYDAAGTLTACKPGGQCEEILVEGTAIRSSWDLARQASVADCEATMEELANGLLAFDGYISVSTSVDCYPTFFDRKLGLKQLNLLAHQRQQP
jgi:hypothetical protein